MHDILEGKNLEVKIGEHGVVRLMDCMPRLVDEAGYARAPGEERSYENFDHAVCEAARVSYGNQDQKKAKRDVDRGLIRYLWRNHHGTPFEMVDIKFYMALPIFVSRQLIRHRTASINEYSMRYKQPKDRFYIPDAVNIRKQSKVNKQGSEGQVEESVAAAFRQYTLETAAEQFAKYQEHEAQGIGRELNRMNLPLSCFTEWFWEIDLRNLLGFLALRRDPHAQKEIRDYAEALWSLVQPLAPWTCEAFEDFTFESVTLTKLELEALRRNECRKNLAMSELLALGARATDREREEWTEKQKKIFGE